MSAASSGLAQRVIAWQRQHGRHGLPWQGTRDPYRVWLSEIMLQQTQVSTVLEYFARFLRRFPDVQSLAQASSDEVLSLWSGLGYYSRARNLHRCAQDVVNLHGGAFPKTASELQTLPGIGRSTAAAIAAFCFGERVAILDGNVKRVLARVLGFSGDLAVLKQERELWQKAMDLLPTQQLDAAMPSYTQGLMDLGATVCSVKTPACERCPLNGDCVAFSQGRVLDYPVKNRKLKRRSESWWLLLAHDLQRGVWLQRRPATGIWAGLYCVPVFADEPSVTQVLSPLHRSLLQPAPVRLHVLTHRDLHLHPMVARLPASASPSIEGQWVPWAEVQALGLPTPIRKMLLELQPDSVSGHRVRGAASA